jgi:hypothetical protein
MHFSQAIAIIQSQVGYIKNVQVLYNDTNPLDIDLVLNLPQDGIRLFFDPVSQRLKIIEIYCMKLVKLKYCNLPFNSPEVLPSIEQIEHSFGATHPGVYDSEKELFILNFRGLSFYFPVESKFQSGNTHKLGSLQFPPGSSPLVSRMTIYYGSNIEQAYAPELPLSCYHGQLYLQKAEILRGECYTRGIKLSLLAGKYLKKKCPPGFELGVKLQRVVGIVLVNRTVIGNKNKLISCPNVKTMRFSKLATFSRLLDSRNALIFLVVLTLSTNRLVCSLSVKNKLNSLLTNFRHEQPSNRFENPVRERSVVGTHGARCRHGAGSAL